LDALKTTAALRNVRCFVGDPWGDSGRDAICPGLAEKNQEGTWEWAFREKHGFLHLYWGMIGAGVLR